MSPEPLKLVPLIALEVFKVVAVVALPESAPTNVGAVTVPVPVTLPLLGLKTNLPFVLLAVYPLVRP